MLPNWASSRSKEQEDDTQDRTKPPERSPVSWESSLNRTDWSHYTSAQTITASVITTAATLALVRLYKTFVRRVPNINQLNPNRFHKRSLYGYVTSVGDGDNFRLFHTPGGRLMGWGWFPGRRVQNWTAKDVKNKTVHVRIAGVDAPELAHFGRPAQPFGQEALDWLRSFVLRRHVRVLPYRRDQYDRVVCTVLRRRWFFFTSDVGLNMLKRGLATVYEAKFGSEFGNKEEQYRAAEAKAKQKKIGMWQKPGVVGKMLGKKTSFESPRQYKTRMAQEEGKKEGQNTDTTK